MATTALSSLLLSTTLCLSRESCQAACASDDRVACARFGVALVRHRAWFAANSIDPSRPE
jgi:hypothetical protein